MRLGLRLGLTITLHEAKQLPQQQVDPSDMQHQQHEILAATVIITEEGD